MSGFLRTIAIVGGGFSGTVLAVNLLRRPPSGPTRLVLIERSGTVGRGVAYADRPFPYLLNVPAGRMSANSTAPREFLEFVRRRIPTATAEDFLPRSLYGEYLQQLLRTARASAPAHVQLEVWQGEVTCVHRIERHLPPQLLLADGRTLDADDVVLALGNPSPAMLPVAAMLRDHPGYIADPWGRELRFSRNQTLLLIGTGLTTADVINLASADRSAAPKIHALSRHGFVPPRQTSFRPEAFKGDGHALLLAASRSLRGLTSAVRALAAEAERCGGDWREAVTLVRHLAPAIWQRMTQPERERFLRHLRAQWEVHRHRLPPEALRNMDALRAAGRLQIHAGRIARFEPRAGRIDVHWRPRGGTAMQTLTVDQVINCTGPDYAIGRLREPLWRDLVQRGLVVADPLGLGLRTGPKGAVIDASGWLDPHLFYIGPMLRAAHWEATAASELCVHAEQLAAVLAADRG